jgi:capsid portal protein
VLTLKSASATKTAVTKAEPQMHFIQKVLAGDTYLVMAHAAVELEDEWSNLYYTTANQTNLFLQPPFEPNLLLNLVNTNNILGQCVDAMEINIDGTGHTFVAAKEGEEPLDSEIKAATDFFDQPYPNVSFVKIRRKLRRQMESTGYAYLEVLRNLAGDVVGVRNVETAHIRMVKLDVPIQVEKTVMRGGKEVTLLLWERERRFAQRIALKQLVYYRDFGTTRQINRNTGEWETATQKIAPENQGTELICFGINPDVISPYFLPRWINQMPSVIGSRKAEEQNLQFLDSGGLPPAIIFVQGGTLAKDASDQLRMYLSGQNKNKYRAVVVEAQSSSGSIDTAAQVQVKVERFGSQAAQDAMFMKYDAATEDHVRVGFRLPPLFLGKSADHNFATAVASYMVAEAQVFGPERMSFDELITKTLIAALGWTTIKFRSNPITMKDISNVLKGLQTAKDMATRESFLKEINLATGMSLELAAMPQPDTVTEAIGATPADSTVPDGAPTVSQTPHEKLPASTKPPAFAPISKKPTPPPTAPAVGKSPALGPKAPKKASDLIDLAHQYAAMRGLTKKREFTPERQLLLKEEVEGLSPDDTESFNRLLATYTFGKDTPDLVAIAAHSH